MSGTQTPYFSLTETDSLTVTGTATEVILVLTPQTIAAILAISSPAEGMVAYVHDTVGLTSPTWHGALAAGGSTAVSGLVSYNGSAWVYA